jgi:hypothetical protein
MDRMAMQDQGAFKAMWATGLKIPRDPATGEPVEDFIKAIDRMFINENPDGKFGQLEAEDIKQMLEAVRDDVADCAMVVPTSPDQILGKLVNVSGDGLKLAQVSEIKRVRRHIRQRASRGRTSPALMLKARRQGRPERRPDDHRVAQPGVPDRHRAGQRRQVAIGAGMPEEVAWERYFDATPTTSRTG